MDFESIFKTVKDSFCSLWSFKIRGETLELITPYSTTNFKFISIFVTEKNGRFIATDGGWLLNGEYDTDISLNDEYFRRIFDYYSVLYDLQSTEQGETTLYYKTCSKLELLPNLVHDLSVFLSAAINASLLEVGEIKEIIEKERFNREVDTYL